MHGLLWKMMHGIQKPLKPKMIFRVHTLVS